MAKQQLTTLSRELNEAYMRKAWFLWNTLLHQVVPPQDNEEAFVGRIALTLALADRPPTADDMIGYPRESINQSPEGLAKLHEHLRKERNLSDAELPTPDELAETFRKEIEEKAIPKFQRTVREEKYRNGSRLTPFSMR